MAKSGERAVRSYLEGKGLKVVKIPEGDIKTVDFEVYSGADLVCCLEEKTLELMPLAWKNIDPIYNSIARHIYEAIKQFKSANPNRVVPNVLALTNMDPGRGINDLFITLTGHVITSSGKIRRIQNMVRLENDLPVIDLYLWFDQDRLNGHIYDEKDLFKLEKLLRILDLGE